MQRPEPIAVLGGIMFKEDELTFVQEEAKAEGRQEGRADMLIKIAEILSDEKMGFPGFTGDNLEWVFHKLGLHINHKQKGKQFIVTEEDSGNYRFNQYDRPVVGDMVEIICPSIQTIIDSKIITIIKPYIKKV